MATVFEVRDETWGGRRADDPAGQVPERQGRRPVADRGRIEAIVFVMLAGIAWGVCQASLAAQEDWQRPDGLKL